MLKQLLGGSVVSPAMVKLLLSQLTDDEGAHRMADLILEGGFENTRVLSAEDGSQQFVEVTFDKHNGSGTMLMTFTPKKTVDSRRIP